jgi:hypothetical protein
MNIVEAGSGMSKELGVTIDVTKVGRRWIFRAGRFAVDTEDLTDYTPERACNPDIGPLTAATKALAKVMQ